MLFSLLLSVLDIAIGLAARWNKPLKAMITTRNHAYVIMTRDGRTGRRFIFRKGAYSSDKVLTDYDMALVFKDGRAGFRALALGDTGIQYAINDWDLIILGDDYHMIWFGVVMQMALGGSKRK